MAADFNAGSIEGTLDLNVEPFRKGLDHAKADAKKFADTVYRAKLGLDVVVFDAERDKVKADLAELDGYTAKPRIDITDVASTLSKIATVKMALASIPRNTTASLGLGSALESDLSRLGQRRGPDGRFIGAGTGSSGGGGRGGFFSNLLGLGGNPFDNSKGIGRFLDLGGVSSIAGNVLRGTASLAKPLAIGTGVMGVGSLVPAITAAVSGLGVFAAAAVAGAATLGIASKGYMALVKADLGKLSASSTGSAGAAYSAIQGLKGAATNVETKTAPGVYGVIAAGSKEASSVLPKLIPIVNTISKGLEGVIAHVHELTDSKLFTRFLGSVQSFLGGFLKGAGPDLEKAFGVLMKLFIGLRPVMGDLGTGITMLLDKADKFTSKLVANNSLAHFGQSVKATFGPVLDTLGQVVKSLFDISKSLAPIRQPFLDFLSQLAKAVGHLDFHDLAKGFGSVLSAITPVLHAGEVLINALIKPLSQLLTGLSQTVIAPLAKALDTGLAPAFREIGNALSTIMPDIVKFIASFSNIINPTGIQLFTSLVHSLVGAFIALAPPLLQIGTSLESVVDAGLKSALPIIIAVANALSVLATTLGSVLAPVVGFVTGFAPVTHVLGLALDAFVAFKLASSEWALGFIGGVAKFKAGVLSTLSGIRTMGVATEELATETTAAGESLISFGARAEEATATTGRFGLSMGKLGKGALIFGAIAVASSGLTQKLNLNNTAMLGLMGTMLGPWGAAAGATIGLYEDLTNAAKGYNSSLTQLTTASGPTQTTQAYIASLKEMNTILHESAWTQGTTALGAILTGHSPFALGEKIQETKVYLDSLTGSMKQAAAAAGAYGDKAQVVAQHQIEMQKTAQASAGQFRDISSAVQGADGNLDKFKASMDQQARAVANFGLNAQKAADNGIRQGLIKQIVAMGPAGALLLQHLANASKGATNQINASAANLAKQTSISAQRVANALHGITNPNWAIKLNIPNLDSNLSKLLDLKGVLLNLPPLRSTNVPNSYGGYTNGRGGGNGGGVIPTHRAVGGVTRGPASIIAGDNPGGQEAIVPLDKYDIPRRGELAALAQGSGNSDLLSKILSKLMDIHSALLDNDPEAIATAMGKLNTNQMQVLVQQMRAVA